MLLWIALEVLEHERTSEAVTRIGMFFLTIFCQSVMTIERYGFFRVHLNFTDMRTGSIDVTVGVKNNLLEFVATCSH
jgi:hypothetical protein